MAVHEDGFYLAERVRRLCTDRPYGFQPWKGPQICALLERASRVSGDHTRFYLAFLEGVRELLDDEDADAVLTRFSGQAMGSEARVLADSQTTRDHLTHVTQVFLVGWLILNECGRFRTFGDEWIPYGWAPRELRFERLNQAWLFTALLHDCAYSVELASEARAHDVRVRSMFGSAYPPKRFDAMAARASGKCLWQRRAQLIGRPLSSCVSTRLEKKVEQRPDHAFVTGQALMAEAATNHSGDTRDILETAAVSLACHNFRHHVDPQDKPDPEIVEWFSLDFWQEPLAALLTVSDEIQEWGRERPDLAVSREQGREDFRAADVTLTHLVADDTAGLSVDVRLLFRLFPEDRANRQRMATERELKNVVTNRTYRNGFKPRDTEHSVFDLHLRIEETVEDVPCRVGRRFGWPRELHESLRQRGEKAVGQWREPPSLSAVETRVPSDKDSPSVELSADGKALVHSSQYGCPVRLLVVAPGGAGKSTLLRLLAKSGRVDRQRAEAIYVDELGDELSDLREECERVRAEADRDVLLLVDHLDRLVGTQNETYWLDQLESLAPEPWLHVVGACRPEEFDAVVGHSLGDRFRRAELTERVGLLMEQTDADGRATAIVIERHLRGSDAGLEELGGLAAAMRGRRFLERPAMPDSSAVTFADGPAVSFDSGKVRFVHDAVQDYFAARRIALELGRSVSVGVEGDAGGRCLRSLLNAPRDVFRLLLDIVVTSRKLDGRRQAALGLAHGLFRESTLRHWLYDFGRLLQARRAIPQFRDAFKDDPEVGPMAQALFGLLRYSEFLPSGLEETSRTREEQQAVASDVVDALATAIAGIDQAFREENSDTTDAEVLTVYLADHLVTVLSRVAVCNPTASFAEELLGRALSSLDGVQERGTDALSPAWVRRRLRGFEANDTQAGTLKRMDADVVTRARANAAPSFAVRQYQLAGHVGGTYLLRRDFDESTFREALRWGDRAIARAARVLRAMDQPGLPMEQFASLAHGRSDAARHHSARVFFWIRAVHAGLVDRDDGRYRLLEAVQAQEGAWRAAKAALRPGERLPAAHWNVLADFAFGKVLAKADRCGGLSVESVARELHEEEEAVLRFYRRWAERHARFTGECIYRFLEDRIGSLPEFVARFAEPFGSAP